MTQEVKPVTKESLRVEIAEMWRTIEAQQRDIRELWLKVMGLPADDGPRKLPAGGGSNKEHPMYPAEAVPS